MGSYVPSSLHTRNRSYAIFFFFIFSSQRPSALVDPVNLRWLDVCIDPKRSLFSHLTSPVLRTTMKRCHFLSCATPTWPAKKPSIARFLTTGFAPQKIGETSVKNHFSKIYRDGKLKNKRLLTPALYLQ